MNKFSIESLKITGSSGNEQNTDIDNLEKNFDDYLSIEEQKEILANLEISRGNYELNMQNAVEHAIKFARQVLSNKLSDSYRFILNDAGKYDGIASLKKLQDSQMFESSDITSDIDNIVERTWSNGIISRSVNVYVFDQDDIYTYVKLDFSIKKITDKSQICHLLEGRPPFHVKAPPLPPNDSYFVDGHFDLHWNKRKI